MNREKYRKIKRQISKTKITIQKKKTRIRKRGNQKQDNYSERITRKRKRKEKNEDTGM